MRPERNLKDSSNLVEQEGGFLSPVKWFLQSIFFIPEAVKGYRRDHERVYHLAKSRRRPGGTSLTSRHPFPAGDGPGSLPVYTEIVPFSSQRNTDHPVSGRVSGAVASYLTVSLISARFTCTVVIRIMPRFAASLFRIPEDKYAK